MLKTKRATFPVAILALALSAVPSHAGDSSPGARVANDPNIFVNLAKAVVPSVVNISTVSTIKNAYSNGTPDEMFRKFFEEFFKHHGGQGGQGMPNGGGPSGDDDEDGAPRGNPQKPPKAMSLGTGFVIDSSGLILTNNHVVEGADEIKIYFTEDLNEKPTDGKVVGRDPEIDVALIKVKTSRELTALSLGNSDTLEVGEFVMAVGNPFGQGHSVTHGIISAKGRMAPDFPLANYLQTDAPINPGNSGGPLLNLKGEVIGINNAIDARAQGIGFAIPISLVKGVLPQLRSKGTVTRGFIGVVVEPMTPELAPKLGVSADVHGPFVSNVNPGGPAEKAGLQVYDVILKFNGKPVKDGDDLVSAVVATPVGNKVPVTILRAGKEQTLEIKVTQRPQGDELAKGSDAKPKKGKKAPVDTGMEIEALTTDIAKDLGLKANAHGIVVDSTSYGGAADQAGLVRGDVILEVDRKPVGDEDAFYSIVKEKKSYLLRVRRSDSSGAETYSVIILDLKASS